MSDIMSRQVEVTDAFVDDLFTLQDKLLPRAPAGTRTRISSVQYLAVDDTYQVLWSEPFGGGEAMANEDIPLSILPEMADFDTIIITELTVPYQPFTHWAKIEVTEWSFALVSRPRYVSAIAMISTETETAESSETEPDETSSAVNGY